ISVSRVDMLCISLDLAPSRRCKVEWATISTPHDKSASFALDRLTISVRLPSRRLIRYIPGHFGSATMRGFMFGGLRGGLIVPLRGVCPLEMSMVAVTLRTASAATLGRFTATLTGVPRSRVRCAAFRQRGLQKRAVDRCSLNCAPQAAHSVGLAF